MIDAPIAVAFGAGMLATVNPCGFVMLPAYLSYFLGGTGSIDTDAPRIGAGRAIAVGAVVSAGFMSLFALAGALLSWGSVSVYAIAPWLTLVISVALVAVGVAMLIGWEPSFSVPRLEKGGKDRTLSSMFLFGVSYAVASLGCTLPVFVATVSGTIRRHNVASGLLVYVAYGLGMAVVMMALTVAIAGARVSLVHGLRGIMPYVSRIAGALVLAAGVYIGWYGLVELRNLHGTSSVTGGRSVSTVTGWSGSIANWVDGVGAVRIGLVLGLAITVALFVSLLRAPRESED
ncbi:MAG: cytochrome c biogenesis protein CcdA [Actinobacteria bacterium]|nr:cytochrome c biogenesis protein CcdA [Actinomycetota bacterium]